MTQNTTVVNFACEIIPVESVEQVTQARQLFEEYAWSTGLDLGFQGFAEELATLPGAYAPPTGRLLLAQCGCQIAGCVGLRLFADDISEMKRLYVRPALRGQGVGRALAQAVIQAAREIDYGRMRLDTLGWMREALSLYRSLGFSPIAAYRHNPCAGAVYLELDLRTPSRDSAR
jgi:GNAT superfamily N-acetyltransferase